MANITVTVQSLLNSATDVSITIDNALTIADLKSNLAGVEGYGSDIVELFYKNAELADATVISAAGLISGSYVSSSNNISNPTLWTKEERQTKKLDLAEARRQADGDATKNYYRVNNVYSTTLLPNPYNGNDTAPDDGASTLSNSRPWTT